MQRDLWLGMVSLNVYVLEDPQADPPVLVFLAVRGRPQVRPHVERGQECVREY
jgi:hypothetical protein